MKQFKVAALQGNLTQRRVPKKGQTREAIDIYLKLSKEAIKLHPDLIIWPESAVPIPYNMNRWYFPDAFYYQNELDKLVKQSKIPFLIGALMLDDFKSAEDYTMANSVLLIDDNGKIADRYDKIHIVPFGEFVPGRKFLPEFIVKLIDMGRDLKRGTDYTPIMVAEGVFAGINICFEDVFAEIAVKEAQLGANLLITVTNDAWYPNSSEPTQHLANSIFRSVETRLPMVRCGNNSSTVLVDKTGQIVDAVYKEGDKLNLTKRGQEVKLFDVPVDPAPRLTFYTRYGDVFIWFCLAIFIAALVYSINVHRMIVAQLSEKFE